MLKSFVFNLYLMLLAGQLACEAATVPELEDDEFEVSEFNATDDDLLPEPRFIQVRSNQKTYTVNLLPVNWHTARELCTAQNQVLASIRNLQENRDIANELMRYGIFGYDNTFWIGGSQLGHIGQWSWVATGQPFTFTFWQRNQEPDHYYYKHCVEISIDGRWSSNDCDQKRPVICEDLPPCYGFN